MTNVLSEMDDLMAELGLLDTQQQKPNMPVVMNTPIVVQPVNSASSVSPSLQPVNSQPRGDPILNQGEPILSGNSNKNGIISYGPGSELTKGPISSGPGAMSSGPGVMSSGPGFKMSSGPGMMSSGPGLKMSSGPGLSMNASTSPGMQSATSNQMMIDGLSTLSPINLAAVTPDGRVVKAQGPTCGACHEMIIGISTNALGKSYHPEHFVCTYCKLPFKGSFIEHEDKLYCENDYNELFSPRCYTCQKPIEDSCITALGNRFHPDCFSCSGCGDKLKGKPYKEEDGEVYCTQCRIARQRRLAAKSEICAKCKLPITGEYIILQGQPVHSEHYRCEECGCEFTGKSCHEYEGRFYCYEDYQKQIRNICGACNKPIIGRSVTALGKVWHPEHFTCTTCQIAFAGSSFREHGGKPYCESHYHQFFGRMCNKCNKPVVEKGVEVFGKIYHREHFTCTGCDSLLGKEIMEWDGKPLCFKCHDALPKEVKKRIKEKKAGDKKATKEREKLKLKEAKELIKQREKEAKAKGK